MNISEEFNYYTFHVKHGSQVSDRVQVRAHNVAEAEEILRDVRIDGERIEQWKLEHRVVELTSIRDF